MNTRQELEPFSQGDTLRLNTVVDGADLFGKRTKHVHNVRIFTVEGMKDKVQIEANRKTAILSLDLTERNAAALLEDYLRC